MYYEFLQFGTSTLSDLFSAIGDFLIQIKWIIILGFFLALVVFFLEFIIPVLIQHKKE